MSKLSDFVTSGIALRWSANVECEDDEMSRNMAAVELSDPLYEAFQRGAEIKRKMLEAEGGVLTAKQFSEERRISLLELGRMRKRNEVFWLDVGKDYVYPSFQLDSNGLLPGIQDVLNAFVFDDSWMRANFMLTGEVRLGGQRSIDALRESRIIEMKIAAEACGELGAA